jgi:tyrosine-specific transport protein
MTTKNVIGGAFLVAGTSIGAGMLGLPVLTGIGGFGPSILVYLLCWFFMTCTGLLFLEICLKMPPNANLVSMATTYLGLPGKVMAWVLYLFLFYCLSVAYVSGGGGFLREWLGLGSFTSAGILFVLLFAPFVCCGTKFVNRLNIFLMIGLIGTYFLFVFFSISRVNLNLLGEVHWGPAILALPIIFTSFSYQGIIPSLTSYLQRDAKKIRLAIILGTTLTFFTYLFWEFLILGIVPIDGLMKARALGQTAVQPLREQVPFGPIVFLGEAFGFLAIATSYLGVTLGLFHFLEDGLKLTKKIGEKFFVGIVTFLPPLAISLAKPGIFLSALTYAGGIGCAVLLGLLPTVMVWKARNRRQAGPEILPGGKLVLSALALFVVLEVAMELFNELIVY